MRTLISAILILATCGGCSTFVTFCSGSEHRWLYSGTRNDLELIRPKRFDCTGFGPIVGIVDLPWSLAVDTALIPVTLPLQLILGSPEPAAGRAED
jgi:uncharacterized protein YceK